MDEKDRFVFDSNNLINERNYADWGLTTENFLYQSARLAHLPDRKRRSWTGTSIAEIGAKGGFNTIGMRQLEAEL